MLNMVHALYTVVLKGKLESEIDHYTSYWNILCAIIIMQMRRCGVLYKKFSAVLALL